MIIRDDSPRPVNTNSANKVKNIDTNNITELLLAFKGEHRNVFIEQIGDYIFIYRSLNRKEYKLIFEDEHSNSFEKEDIICNTCLLWPEDFDFDVGDAGIPTSLCKAILSNSFLSTADDKYDILDYYREDMFSIDNQIICMINEAFPHTDIEEIEEWDMEKTMKYLSRAEWKLHNLRGLDFVETNTDRNREGQEAQQQQQQEAVTEEIGQETGAGGEELTPQKLAELQQQFPEIDWTNDSVAKHGEEALNVKHETLAPALRTGF